MQLVKIKPFLSHSQYLDAETKKGTTEIIWSFNWGSKHKNQK